MTGEHSRWLEPLDGLMASFMAERKAPGGALAVTKDRRLAYARGFGLANVEQWPESDLFERQKE